MMARSGGVDAQPAHTKTAAVNHCFIRTAILLVAPCYTPRPRSRSMKRVLVCNLILGACASLARAQDSMTRLLASIAAAVFVVATLAGQTPSTGSGQGKQRARDLGIPFDGAPGPLNAITDVAGIEVGF